MQQQLQRQLGLGSATAMVVGEVIAVGIFLTPAGMTKSLGSPFWLLAVWVVMGVMALCGALCYGELAARFPEAGGGYVYLREAYGPRTAFLYGWKCFLVMDPGITAALAVGLSSYLGYLISLSPLQAKLAGVGVIAGLAAVNISGVRLGAGLLRGLTALKLGAISLIVVWAVVFRLGDVGNFVPFVAQRPGSAPLFGALAGAMIAAFFSFGGWWDASKLAGEVRDPARTLPRALTLGVAIVTAVYLAMSAVFLYLVPLERVSSGETFAAQAGESLFGRAGGQVFSVIVIVSVIGSLAAIMMSAPRVYFAMARDGLFFRSAGALSQRTGAPVFAILLQATLASLLVLFGAFDQIIAYFLFVTLIFIGLTVAAVFRLRPREPEWSGSRAPGYPITPLIFLILFVLLLVLLGGNNPKQSLLGLVIVICGFPAYHLFARKDKNYALDSHDSIGGG